jgi:small subunit ribosomal protein S15e
LTEQEIRSSTPEAPKAASRSNAGPLSIKAVDRRHSPSLSLFLSTSTASSRPRPLPLHSFQRGLQRKSLTLIKKLRSAKRTAAANNEKPDAIRTHLRNTVIVPEMIGSVIGVYNGKTFNQVEVKPDMVGHYLGEFSISYKPVKHGKAGIGSTTSSRFIPLK